MDRFYHKPGDFLCPYTLYRGEDKELSECTLYPQKDAEGYLKLLEEEIYCIEHDQRRKWAHLWDTKSGDEMESRALQLCDRVAAFIGVERYNELAEAECYVVNEEGTVTRRFSRIDLGKAEVAPWTYMHYGKATLLAATACNEWRAELFFPDLLRITHHGVRVPGPKRATRKKLHGILDTYIGGAGRSAPYMRNSTV